MSRTSIQILPNTMENMGLTGDPVRVDMNRFFTVAIHTSNFTGHVRIEATTEVEPIASDWFAAVPLYTYDANTSVTGVSFKGSYTYIRARMFRDQVDPPQYPGGYGTVDRILMNSGY